MNANNEDQNGNPVVDVGEVDVDVDAHLIRALALLEIFLERALVIHVFGEIPLCLHHSQIVIHLQGRRDQHQVLPESSSIESVKFCKEMTWILSSSISISCIAPMVKPCRAKSSSLALGPGEVSSTCIKTRFILHPAFPSEKALEVPASNPQTIPSTPALTSQPPSLSNASA